MSYKVPTSEPNYAAAAASCPDSRGKENEGGDSVFPLANRMKFQVDNKNPGAELPRQVAFN